MKLVSVLSEAENDFLEQQIREQGLGDLHFWTSALNLVGGNRWIWMSTGKRMIYTNWNPGEPNNAKNSNENCMEMRILERGLVWNDLPCSNELSFICYTSGPKDCFKLLRELNRAKSEPSELEASMQTVSPGLE